MKEHMAPIIIPPTPNSGDAKIVKEVTHNEPKQIGDSELLKRVDKPLKEAW